MMISDKPVNVGDACRVGDVFGSVEDIGLRSTRIRTLDRTVVSIPNGQLATMSLENFAVRDRIWFHHTVGLGFQTTADQMRRVLTRIRQLLGTHPKVDASSARTRFIRFGAWSLDVEVFAYVLERDPTTLLAIQEELLLGIMGIIDTSGTSVALPPTPGTLRKIERSRLSMFAKEFRIWNAGIGIRERIPIPAYGDTRATMNAARQQETGLRRAARTGRNASDVLFASGEARRRRGRFRSSPATGNRA